MDFDYYAIYQEYTNDELLAIVREPYGYQQMAVDAARKILSERKVSVDEVTVAENEVAEEVKEIETNTLLMFVPIHIRERFENFFEPVLYPGKNVGAVKWLNLLLLIIGAQFIGSVPSNIKYIVSSFRDPTRDTNFFMTFVYTDIFELVYFPIMFVLLMKRMKWGWIILVTRVLVFAIFVIFPMVFSLIRPLENIAAIFSGFSYLIIRTVMLLFLFSPEITTLYGVYGMEKNKILMSAFIFSLACYAAIAFIR